MQSLLQLYRRVVPKQKQRIYILPTRYGVMLGFFLFVMLLGAINYSNSMGHLLVFLLVSLGHTTMLHTHRNISKIELKYAHAEPVYCGQVANFNIVLSNHNDRDLHQFKFATRAEEIKSWNPLNKVVKGFTCRNSLTHIAANQTVSTIIDIPTEKRGYQALGTLQLKSQFPLGLFRSWTNYKTNAKVLVYPNPEGDLAMPNALGAGDMFKQNRQKGLDDFAGFNSYRVGDPVHTIAWKAVARDDVLRTKQFSGAQSGRRILSWNDTAGIADTEKRLSQLCRWLIDTENVSTLSRLELPNKVIDFAVGENHLHECLTALALYHDA